MGQALNTTTTSLSALNLTKVRFSPCGSSTLSVMPFAPETCESACSRCSGAFINRCRGVGAIFTLISAPMAFAPLSPAVSFSSLSARTRFSAQLPCSSGLSMPSAMYWFASQAAVSVSWAPGEVSSMKVRIGLRRLVRSSSRTSGTSLCVEARVWERERYSMGGWGEENGWVDA